MSTLTRTLLACPIMLWRAEELPHPERALARGQVVRVIRGVYAERTAWLALPPWDRYLARVHAVALVDPDAVFTHESAAVAQGMGVIGDPGVVHLLVPARAASRLTADVRTHTTDVERDLLDAGGIVLTSPRDTAVTLARHRHSAVGLAAADAALRVDSSLTREGLVEDNESRISTRGRRIARWALNRATPLSESVLESINMALIEWLGLPTPVQQKEFRSADGTVDRGDAWWEEHRLLAEVDGEFKYDGRFGDPAAALRRRRERDLRLLAEHVAAVVHWGWLETARIAPVRALLTGHGLSPERPENTAQLHSLRRLLASYARPPRETTSERRDRG